MRLATVFIVLAATLAACSLPGGSDRNYPAVDGAEQIESRSVNFSDIQFNYSNSGVAVYESSQPFEQVARYYREGITADGWTVEESIPLTNGQGISYLSEGDTVVIAQVVTGAVARDQAPILSDALETDFSSFEDGDTVIILTHLTCEEDGGPATCIQALSSQ